MGTCTSLLFTAGIAFTAVAETGCWAKVAGVPSTAQPPSRTASSCTLLMLFM